MAADPRIHTDLAHLAGLEARARGFDFLPRQPVGSALSGRRAGRVRGRGLDFEELRAYLPGDDVRAIDWKVTARTGAPTSASPARSATARRSSSSTSAWRCSSAPSST